MPSERELLKILDKDTVDTSRWMIDDLKEAEYQMQAASDKMYGIATPQVDGTLRSWHVTDDPEKVIELLKTEGEFYAREGDLCGGLYVSDVPRYWEGRSQKKWEFLPQMSKDARRKLYEAIYDKLLEEVNTRYITQDEFERAARTIETAIRQDYWQILDIVANQPYNVNIIKIVKDLGLATPFQPHHIRVDFDGRYLEFNTERAINAYMELLRKKFKTTEGLTRTDLCDLLRDYGWDGVYTKASMGTNPELAIWNKDKIVAFGDWMREPGATLGAAGKSTWLVDPTGGVRFEAVVSGNKTGSMIFDKLLKESFDFLDRMDVQDLDKVLEHIGFGEPVQAIGRFESRLLYNTPQIRDVYYDRYFRGLRPQDLDGLEQLVKKLLETME